LPNFCTITRARVRVRVVIDGDIGQFETAQKVAELAIKKFGSIDAVVANAGIFLVKPFTEYTPDDFRALLLLEQLHAHTRVVVAKTP
jgi:NAD(P)-dependent dehydrogenase (short-subunit alcohol dehydrogenase family)